MAKIGDFDIRFQGADARLLALGRIAFALFLYLRYLSSVVLSHVSSFKIQVSRFRFQASYYPTFLPAWKAVLSTASVAWDATSG